MLKWFKKNKKKEGVNIFDTLPPFDEHKLGEDLQSLFKYQEVPDLIGKAVNINSLNSPEKCILSMPV